MRFAGQRFRAQSGSVGKYREGRYRAEDGSSAYANPSGTGAMTQMPEVNAARFSKTSQPDMSNSPFNFPEIQQPEFKATSRI